MKKKALSFLLAAISAFSLVLPAFATTDTDDTHNAQGISDRTAQGSTTTRHAQLLQSLACIP